MFKPFRILILCLTLAGSAVSYIKMQTFLVAFDLDAIIDGGQNPFDQVIAPTATKPTFSQVENNIDWHNFGIGALLILATIGGVFLYCAAMRACRHRAIPSKCHPPKAQTMRRLSRRD